MEFLTSFYALLHFIRGNNTGEKRSGAYAVQMTQEEILGIQTGPCI